ncbi:hypothetical protein, partial [Isoptericola sp. NPDC057559]|uniref:hypothetical protein n=1 Tax=Isoptericola sp. NPDC057559 TaxID=3346168 RepID=UPI00369A44A6
MSSVPRVDTALATPALARAVEIFRELGWDGADPQDALTLPLGSPEQRRAALAGLRRGPWRRHVVPDVPVTLGSLHDGDDDAWGWAAATDVDLGLLTLFAVRQGVDAARAVRLLTDAEGLSDDLVARVVSTRGADFAARFVERAGTASSRWGDFSTMTMGGVQVLLVHRLGLDVPDDAEYLRDWAAYAAATLPGAPEEWPGHWRPLPADLLRPRYAEHARAAVAAGLPPAGPLGRTVAAAVDAGWVAREEAADLAFQALDAAVRPGDRRSWTAVLAAPATARIPGLAVTPTEVLARADLLVGVLATGEAPLVEAFAPALVAGVDDATLGDVLLVSLAVGTKKAQRVVLAAAARRAEADGGAGPEVVELVRDRVAELAAGRDPAVARAARAVLDAWGLAAPAAVQAEPAATAPSRWRPTPPVWTPPRFAPPEATGAAITAAAAALTRQPEGAADLALETFLHLAVRVARRDPEEARTALRGVGRSWQQGLGPVHAWVHGERPEHGLDASGSAHGVLRARDHAVFERLGEVPALLSTPSRVDLSVDPADLADRLGAYAAAGAPALEADLLLALTRLDVATATPEVLDRLRALEVPVQGQRGRDLRLLAGPVAVAYVADPVPEPELVRDERWDCWRADQVVLPRSLRGFPRRIDTRGYAGHDAFTVFPGWGEAAVEGLVHSEDPALGVTLRQAARRATPFGPAGAVNLLGSQRRVHDRAAEDASAAVLEAWDRGLLRPGVADAAFLDLRTTPRALAALATAMVRLADEGLASVVWPVLDGLLAASQDRTRLLAGTAELAEAMLVLAPDAAAAVATGVAGPAVVAVPGLRRLAARPGSSRAVVAAREAVTALPPAPLE